MLSALSGSDSYQETKQGWAPTISISRLRCMLALYNLPTANFEAALAIQTATTDTESPNTSVILGSWVSTAGRNLRDIDVTNVNNGDVTNPMFFRLLIAYRIKAGGGTFERGGVTLLPTWRA